ncbi:unnamed protein product [Closterium sp. NIES-53]
MSYHAVSARMPPFHPPCPLHSFPYTLEATAAALSDSTSAGDASVTAASVALCAAAAATITRVPGATNFPEPRVPFRLFHSCLSTPPCAPLADRNLAFNMLSGSIPTELFSLTNLTYL